MARSTLRRPLDHGHGVPAFDINKLAPVASPARSAASLPEIPANLIRAAIASLPCQAMPRIGETEIIHA
jgi:hypothetical protein